MWKAAHDQQIKANRSLNITSEAVEKASVLNAMVRRRTASHALTMHPDAIASEGAQHALTNCARACVVGCACVGPEWSRIKVNVPCPLMYHDEIPIVENEHCECECECVPLLQSQESPKPKPRESPQSKLVDSECRNQSVKQRSRLTLAK